MQTITVRGQASRKTILENKIIKVPKEDLMTYLRQQGVSISSSCYGEGVCKKCEVLINGMAILSCQKTLEDYPQGDIIIEVGYL